MSSRFAAHRSLATLLACTAAVLAQVVPAAAQQGLLTKAFLRATHPALSAADFERKWQASLASPVLFVRAYPAGFHLALKQARVTAPTPVQTSCVGDAHPGNFGFLALERKTAYAYNDLDDSGTCPVAYDVLRYFTALRMFFRDDALTRDVLERFVDATKDAGRASGVPGSFAPDWAKVRKKGLAEHTRDGRLAGTELSPASAAERTALVQLFARDARLRDARVLDVAVVARAQGGSGGLRRYWVLAQRAAGPTILELKEAVTPGVEWGVFSRKLAFASRLETLKPAFWGARLPGDYFYVALGRTTFLVRDRFTKKSLDVLELGGKDRKDVLQAQASWLGLLHARALAGVKKDDLRAWLLTESAFQAKLWNDAHRAARR